LLQADLLEQLIAAVLKHIELLLSEVWLIFFWLFYGFLNGDRHRLPYVLDHNPVFRLFPLPLLLLLQPSQCQNSLVVSSFLLYFFLDVLNSLCEVFTLSLLFDKSVGMLNSPF